MYPPDERQYVLRMPVRVDGGAYRMPPELRWCRTILWQALAHQRTLRRDHPFCYVTVRHGVVESVTDDEWHVDGFSTRVMHVPEQNYVWCSASPTEWAPMLVEFPADFDPLRHNVNHYLQRHVNPYAVRQLEPRLVYCMDPYVLHRRPPVAAGTPRTFVRVSCVPIEIDDHANTQNPRLPRTYTRSGVEHRNSLETYGAP